MSSHGRIAAALSGSRSGSVSLRNAWRDSIRDSELDSTAKLVGLVMETYMNTSGECFPSKATLTQGCSIADIRTVDRAVKRLELAGLLKVERSTGYHSNRYRALLPYPGSDEGVREKLDPGSDEGVREKVGDGEPRLRMRNTPAEGPYEPKDEPKPRGERNPLPPRRRRTGGPLIGDAGYPAFLAAALSKEHATELEVAQAFSAHKFVVGTRRRLPAQAPETAWS